MKRMIAILSTIALPLFAATSTMETEGRSPSIGIQAGLNFETATTPSQISSNTQTGFSVGATLELPVTSFFSIQPELNYVSRGLNLVNAGGLTANVYYHSIEVPVFAKLGFGEKVRPFVFAGPMAVWNVSTEVQGSLGGSSTSASFNPNTFDFAAVGGLGIEAGMFFADIRYVLGLVAVNANSSEWQSRGFRLMAGLRI